MLISASRLRLDDQGSYAKSSQASLESLMANFNHKFLREPFRMSMFKSVVKDDREKEYVIVANYELKGNFSEKIIEAEQGQLFEEEKEKAPNPQTL